MYTTYNNTATAQFKNFPSPDSEMRNDERKMRNFYC